MNVIVIGKNHNNTLGLIWSLHEGGHKVILLLYEEKFNYVSKSRFVDKFFLIKKEDNVINLLKVVSSSCVSKPVVLASNDDDAFLLNAHSDELLPYCFFEGGVQEGGVNRYRNKDEGEKLAKQCGLTIPQTSLIFSQSELFNLPMEYPLFIKANNSIHGGKLAMCKCDSLDEAECFVRGIPKEYFPLQVQKFIDKDFELMLLGCSLFGGKNVVIPVANKKIRQYPQNTGGGAWSQSLEVGKNNDLVQLSDKVAMYLRQIEYTGNFSAEFLYSGGKYYFLEINLRNDGTSWLSTCSGYNLPDMVCRSFGDPKFVLSSNTFHQMYYMNVVWNFCCMIKGDIGVIEWLKQFGKKTCYSHYNKHDMVPFFTFLFYYVISTLKRKIHL